MAPMTADGPGPLDDADPPGERGRAPLDMSRIIQVAGTGFIVLIIAEGIGNILGGGLLVPFATAVAYVYIGRRSARGLHRPMAHGAAGAGMSYTLLLPLQFFLAANSDDPIFTPTMGELAYRGVVSIVLALGIGAMAGRIQGAVDAGDAGDTESA